MRLSGFIAAAVLATGILGGGAAQAANICRTERLSCATTMPIGGYCECTSRGNTEDGTVMARGDRTRPVDATAGGCGANPRAPGCR